MRKAGRQPACCDEALKRKALPKNKLGRMLKKLEHLKASVRAKVEHPFHVVKYLFRHRKVRYRDLAKNTAQSVHAVRLCQSGTGRPAGNLRTLKPELRLNARIKGEDPRFPSEYA